MPTKNYPQVERQATLSASPPSASPSAESAHSESQKFESWGFESWGRYPRAQQQVIPLFWADEFPSKAPPVTLLLPVGMGRSYGDVCLNDGHAVLPATQLNRFLNFDPATGILSCEAGVTLAQILEFFVPRGWFLPVVPGTKFVTVAGAIANDIHGKNHHIAGTFGCHLQRLELVRSDGSRMICGPTENAEYFRATIGGMGLTGFIAWAEIQLRPIVAETIAYRGTQYHGLAEFFALSDASPVEYTVSWIDCVARGNNWARGIFMEGDHSQEADSKTQAARKKPVGKLAITFPFDLPRAALNRTTVGLFNTLYFHKQRRKRVESQIGYEPFFFPLDAIHHWNRMYGSRGLMQFQCVVPRAGIQDILKVISTSGQASFLAVLKVFGDVVSPGLMSFPKPGVTLALDFPIKNEASFDLVDRLGKMTLEMAGRLYPAKDSRMTASQFRAFYPQWQDFSRFIDPAFSSSFWRRVAA